MSDATPDTQPTAPTGLRAFLWIWAGQTLSMIGTGITGFALGVWIYQTTGSVTQFTLAAVFVALPGILLGPFLGVLVDRWDRRWAMILADLGSVVRVVFLLVLIGAESLELEVWHIYLAAAVRSVFDAIQMPAYMASVPLMVPKEQLGRINGLIQFSPSASQVVAPAAAGLLLPIIGLEGVLWIDIATFLFAVVVLLAVRIPRPKPAEGDGKRPTMWQQAALGWHFVRDRPGLLSMAIFFAAINLVVGFAFVLVTPLVLALGGSETELGFVLSLGSIGMVLGSVLMTSWGGPKKKIWGVLITAPWLGLAMVLTGFSPLLPVVTAGVLAFYFGLPVINACAQTIWQVKVEPALQGRVFAMLRVVGQISLPIAYLSAGPLADSLEPLMAAGGRLAAGPLGQILGVGPGRGIGLQLVAMGGLLALLGIAGAFYPRLRHVEDELPDAV
ncbi:MAG: MFS transporter [Acidobacteriota bacterium]